MCSKYADYCRINSQHDWREGWGGLFNEREDLHFEMNKISIWAPKIVRQMTKTRFVTNEKYMQRASIQIPHTYITSCCIDTSFDPLKPPFKAIDMDKAFCFFTNVGLQKALETLTSNCYYWLPHNKQLMVGSHGVPSPNMEAKFPAFEPQENNQIWSIIIKVGSWLFYA